MSEAAVHPRYRADRVYLRDASVHSSIGRATQFHWSRPDDPALAVCSRNVGLLSDTWSYRETNEPGENPDEVAAISRCMASGCKQRWAQWDEDAWYRTAVAKAQAEWATIKDGPHTGAGEDLCALCWAGDGDPRCQRCGCSVGFPGCQCPDGTVDGACHALVVEHWGVGPGFVVGQ